MLASLFINFAQSVTTGGGFADDRLYHALLHRRKALAKRKREFQEAETAKREELARLAFETVRAAKPELARQIVAPHAVYTDAAPRRYEVDWPRLINDLYAYELLARWQMEIEDEEALILILAADY